MDIYRKISSFFSGLDTEKRIVGSSLLKRNLYAIKLGKGEPVGIAVYGIHAREWITAKLAMTHYAYGAVGSVWLLPLINPDGALLSQKGLFSAKDSAYVRFLSAYGDQELRLWKANARGVDLNVNFDAEWGKGKYNVRKRGGANYIGERPFSEPETLALKKFTQEISPDYTVSFHTKGEDIYWYFGQSLDTCLRDYRIARALEGATGYPLRLAKGSVGGYKDWCISTLKIPSFTVEVGNDGLKHPLRGAAFTDICRRCGSALYALSKAVKDLG